MVFNAEQWSRDHEKADDMRFRAIFSILAVAGSLLLGLGSWSLKAQYDGMHESQARAEKQLETLYTVSNQVHHVDTQVSKAP